jgi:hypothetical protein
MQLCFLRNVVAYTTRLAMDQQSDIKPYATLPSKHHKYTIRTLFEEYRDNGGSCWVDADPPEYSVTSDTGEITCMVKMKRAIGIPQTNEYVGLCPVMHKDIDSMLDRILNWIGETIDSGNLWCPPGSVKLKTIGNGKWAQEGRRLDDSVSAVVTSVQDCKFEPLSVSTVHSALESNKVSNEKTFCDFYPFPRTTTPSTSLFGTSHNNSFVDMSPEEKDKEPDIVQREFRDDYVGFICACHTSHSYEAGRSRRVTMDIVVRLTTYETYASVEGIRSRQVDKGEDKDWTLWCCGQYCYVSVSTVHQICIYHRLKSMSADPRFGLYIRESLKVCVISVSSGTLVKLCTNSVWSDNVNAYTSDNMKFSVKPYIATAGADFHRSCLSGHFSYVPFIEHNAAIRTSITSAQITQAVSLPFCPATAAVSPCYTFQPLVTTPVYARIMIEQESAVDLASYMPGETVSVLYHNLPLNYEDAIIVSKRYVQNGGFSTSSVCRYMLPASDYVSPVGKILCSRLSKWWKSPCQRHCLHTIDYVEKCNVTSPFGPPTGTVLSKRVLKTGEQSIKVKSYETFQPGNKLSTGHGQKGVNSILMEHEDMPVCYTKDGDQMVPDAVVAVASIVRRQTLGQIYESGAGIEKIKYKVVDGVRTSDFVRESRIIAPDEKAVLGEEVSVMDGRTGRFHRTLLEKDDSSKSPFMEQTFASFGFVRMYNQSQMTRERHFTSHRSMKSTTLRTPVKRSKGGALKEGEMEIQATVAAGLVNCTEELRKRGDEVVVLVCMSCFHLRLLHSCTANTEFAEVTLPYDVVVLDCINKITYNCVFKYTLEPDV